MEIPPVNARMIVVLNDEPIKLVGAMRRTVIELDDEAVKRGNNVLELAMHLDSPSHELADQLSDELLATLAKEITFTEGANVISEKGEWSFAKWEAPPEIDYDSVSKTKLGSMSNPTWWKTTFKADDLDLAISLDTTGLSKGQAYINGNALGRFFSSTQSGKSIEPSTHLSIPSCWIKKDALNELLIFDEHGASPAKVKLVVEHSAFRD